MATGEGKTLVSTLPVYLNALQGNGVHIITVNDYLAKRDAAWMGEIYEFLGMKVGCIVHGLEDDARRAQYKCDVTYGTNNEFGFDYLRDNMKFTLESMVQRDFSFAIVDEVDSILIDESRTPLIISGPAEDHSEMYLSADALFPLLGEDDYEIDEKARATTLTDAGTEHAEKLLEEQGLLKSPNLYDIENISVVHHINQALRAHLMFERDKDYIVKDGQGHHHRRVHRPHDARPAFFRRPASGPRSQGTGSRSEREPDLGVDHLSELFPNVSQARRHDRHGGHRSARIRRYLQARSGHTSSDQ